MVEEAPGVIALNMRAASACIIEFHTRVFPFREIWNEVRARVIFTLAEGDGDPFAENPFTSAGQSDRLRCVRAAVGTVRFGAT